MIQVNRQLTLLLITLLLALTSAPLFAQGHSAPVMVTGEVAVEIADFFEEGRSETYYFIIDEKSRTRTQVFFQGQPDAAFTSGARVLVRGASRGTHKGLNVQSIELIEAAPARAGAVPLGEPTAEGVVAPPQTRKVLTLIVDFLDAEVDTGTANAVTPLIVSNQMFNDTQNVQHFYDKASLGTFTIPTDPNSIGKEPIFGPYTINYNYLVNNGGTCDTDGWAEAALTAWEADGVGNSAGEDRTDYDSWSLIVPNYWDYSTSNGYTRACTWGGYAGVGCTQCWAFSADPASILFGVVNHELGHNFGFGHANSDIDNDGLNICGYCDDSDQMGGERLWMNFNAPHLDFQGWWDPVNYNIQTMLPSSTQVEYDLISVDEDDTYWLDPRAVKTTRTGSTNYYFSYRQQTDLYDEVPPFHTTGANIHWANSSLSNNYKTNFFRIIEAGQMFEDPAQDLLVWGVGTTQVNDGLGNLADAFTIRVCNSTCATLWPALSLSAAGAFPDTIQLNWQDYTYNEDGFAIEYSPDGSSWSALDTTAADATTYLHSGLTGGSTFYYRVRAYRGASEFSEWSNVVNATTPAASGVIELNIATGDDDVMETTSSGSIWLTSPANFLDYDTWNSRNVEEGLRFRNIPIPKGSTINSAYIQYRSYNSGSGTNTVTFRAEDIDDAAIFTSAANSVTSRTLGSASVDWILSSWGGSTNLQSPDLTSIVQPIVDRAGWAGGNAMVFVTESDHSGVHNVYSYEGSQSSVGDNSRSPKLVIDYFWSPSGGNEAPTAAFTFSCVDLDCSFTDTSTDVDGSIASWSWDFDDTNTSIAQSPAHSFAAYGNYNVSLTVTDDDGDSDAVVVPVTVHPVIRGPYLQTLTDDSVIVRWRTSAATDSVVRFGLSAGALSSTTTVAGSVTEHTVELTGLSPSTEYFYSIGDTGSTFMGDASFHFGTSPVPGTPTPTRFWVIGDSGTANADARAVRDRYKEYVASTSTPSDFMLMLGDNAYNSGTDEEYQAAVFETYPELLRQLPVWPTLGNHDGYTADSATQTGPYYDIFNLPTNAEAGGLASGTEAYYSFDYGNIHFIVLDSYETDRSTGGNMVTWLESDLALNNKPWVIAFWHHPPYTKGSHDSDSEGELIDMRQNALPILEAWGVDLVLGGHSHSYERSMLMDSHYDTSDTLDVGTMIKDIGDGSESGDGAYEKPDTLAAQHEGAVYAVAGSSGKTSGTQPDWPHPIMINYRVQLGSMVIDVNGDTLDAIFLDNNGVVQDDFTIQKVTRNLAPYANAGPDQVVEDSDFQVGESVTLDGSASSDGDGSIVSYNWTWAGGSATGVNPTINLPDGVTAVTLTVTDNDGASDGELVLVTVRAPGTIEVRVTQSSDDAEELTDLAPTGSYATGHITTTSSDLEMVEDLGYHGGDQTIGIRFQNLQVPQGAAIRSASLVLNSDETNTRATTINIQAEDVDDAATFNTTSGNISGRPTTTASVPWSPGSWDSSNVDHSSPDIASVVQEVINRGGWGPGNSMAFILSGSGKRVAESFDGSAGREPSLNIEFNIPPLADAGPDQNVTDSDALPGENVTLDGSGSTDPVGTIVSYDWTWATGSDSGVNPTISLPDGPTVVTLTVTDDNGDTDVDTVSITVELPNVAPTANAGPDQAVPESDALPGESVTLDGSGSTDSDGSIVSWDWNWAGGSTTGVFPTVSLSDGTTVITLTVTDDDGATDVDTVSITVEPPNAAPTADAGPDQTVPDSNAIPGENVTLDGSGSTDSDGSIASYSWTWAGGSTTGVNPTISLGDGNTVITLTVTDNENATDVDTVSITVEPPNVAPTANFTFTPSGISVDFTDNSTDSDGSIAVWSWDFGDTTTTSDTSTAQNPSYVYPDYGTYSVTLTVTDDDGASDFISKDVTLTAPCSGSKTMRAGKWETFSLPCMPIDASVGNVFTSGSSTLTVGGYNTNWAIYVYENLENIPAGRAQGYTRLTPASLLEEGKGYFFYSVNAVDIEVSGELNTSADIPLRTEQLDGIYNLVGNPHNFSVDWDAVTVNNGGSIVSWGNADKKRGSNYDCDGGQHINNCLMSHVMLKWETTVYEASDGSAQSPGILNAIDAIWVRGHKDGIELRIPPTPASAPPAGNVVVASANVAEPGASIDSKSTIKKVGGKPKSWFIRLIAESGDIRDQGNWIGQLSGATDGWDARDLREFAPFGNPYLSILFTNPLFEGSNWGYTTDYRKLTKARQGEWPFVVRASSGITEVTLSWEGDAHLFDNAILVDEVSGQKITLEAGGLYTFEISDGIHAFRMIMN